MRESESYVGIEKNKQEAVCGSEMLSSAKSKKMGSRQNRQKPDCGIEICRADRRCNLPYVCQNRQKPDCGIEIVRNGRGNGHTPQVRIGRSPIAGLKSG